MRRLIPAIAVAGMAALLWLSVQSPRESTPTTTIQSALPDGQSLSDVADSEHLWRVVTHRVFSKEGIAALKKRLESMGLQPVEIRSSEDVTMHAFDDAVIFKTSRKARAAEKVWQKHGIDTHLIRVDKGIYLLSLGRLYQVKYAELLQHELDRVGRKYRYQQRLVPIPVVRFTFAATNKRQAEQLWRKLNDVGVIIPVLMPETRFVTLYGEHIIPGPAAAGSGKTAAKVAIPTTRH